MSAGDRVGMLLGFAALLLAAVGTCCTVPSADGATPGGRTIVVTQVPASPIAEAAADRRSPDLRYPAGSRIVLVTPGSGAREPRILSAGLFAAGAPAVSLDAEAVAFAAKTAPEASWAIFEVRVRRPTPRRLVAIDADCIDPAYLAGDRLVFTCRSGETWALHVVRRDGSAPERITFGPRSAFDPTPLSDGRILFAMRQGPGIGRRDGRVALFTLNPDGTLLEPFTGSHGAPADAYRPRQTADAGVVYLTGGGRQEPPRAARVEMSRPRAAPGLLEPTLAVTAVEPLPDGSLLVAARPDPGSPGAGSGVYRVTRDPRAVVATFDDPIWDEVEAVPLLPSAAPRGRPSAVDPQRDYATLACYDAGRYDSSTAPPWERRRPATVVVETTSRGDGGSVTQGRPLARVPVEPDGSFLLEVPADVPLRVLSFDAEGVEIAASDWFWLRPGEARACFGCHESRDSAPVNRPVAALSREPRRVELAPETIR